MKLPSEESKISFCQGHYQVASWMQTCLHWHTGTGLNSFPTPGLLFPRLLTHKYMLSCRPWLPQVILNVISLSMPQPCLPGVPSSSWTYWECQEPDQPNWWAGMQLAGKQERPARWVLLPNLLFVLLQSQFMWHSHHQEWQGHSCGIYQTDPKWLYNCCFSLAGVLAIPQVLRSPISFTRAINLEFCGAIFFLYTIVRMTFQPINQKWTLEPPLHPAQGIFPPCHSMLPASIQSPGFPRDGSGNWMVTEPDAWPSKTFIDCQGHLFPST